jgi:hypothetical protein
MWSWTRVRVERRLHPARDTAQLRERRIHVDRVPQDDDVGDQAQGPELILLAFAVALARFAALAVEDDSCDAMAFFAAIELVHGHPYRRRRQDFSGASILGGALAS